MDSSYNFVQPIRLGQKKKQPNNNNNNNNNNEQELSDLPQLQKLHKKRKQVPIQNSNYLNNNNNSSNKWALNSMGMSDSEERRRKRAERFNTNNNDTPSRSNSAEVTASRNSFDPLSAVEDYSNLNAIASKSQAYDKNKHIIGTCQNTEKSYLRLTSEPNPALVRPKHILKKAYDILMKKHNKKHVTYPYLCDQFKAIRQDLRVQMIENKFTVLVYETHARLALENGDLGEYNQCQSRLFMLYENKALRDDTNYAEFTSYLILYYILTDDTSAIMSLRLKLMQNEIKVFKNSLVQKSLNLSDAKLTGNYHKFMKICDTITSLGKHLINAFIEKEILRSLNTICNSYNQVGLDFLRDEFHFPNIDTVGLFLKREGFEEFIKTKNPGKPNQFVYLDAKAAKMLVSVLYQKSKKIDLKGQK
ncbi:hypothetical protein C6P45_002001 [Maudiozyma exigua]|uniref:PCI domain-containing protein n=1 Tax=Maudiozyma exigua TaxID=34358 RepID=A0A9P6WDG9_MAUEX|nr:hypothetical protein C6P45_002001 [Kazachstania exigua]